MTFEDRGWARGWTPSSSRGRATIIILAVLVGAHILKVLANAIWPETGSFFGRELSSTASGLAHFEWWRPISYLFVHVDVMHVLWNAIIFGFAGFALERIVGSMAVARIFLVCGAVGSLSVLIWSVFGYPDVRTVGASGAINGVLVALAVVAPEMVVLLFFVFPVKIRWLVAGYVAIDALRVLGDGSGRPGRLDGTDVFCHLLGASSGLVMMWVMPRYVTPWITGLAARRARARRVAIEMAARSEHEELDRILAKIAAQGMPSLTDSERATLKRESERRASGR